MSANNQTLVVEHRGKWLIYPDTMAESWSKNNELALEEAVIVYKKPYALELAHILDDLQGEFEEGTEYGVVVGYLKKDGSKVKII